MAAQEMPLTTPATRRQVLDIARLWRQLQSMTFAIILLSIILIVIVAGSLLPKDAGIRYVYESWWFYALNMVLIASVISCVSRRVGTCLPLCFSCSSRPPRGVLPCGRYGSGI